MGMNIVLNQKAMAAGAAASDAASVDVSTDKVPPVTADFVRETLLQAAREATPCPSTYSVHYASDNEKHDLFSDWDFYNAFRSVEWRIDAKSAEEAIVCLFDQLKRMNIGDAYTVISREVAAPGVKDEIISWAYELSAYEDDYGTSPFQLQRPGNTLLPSPLASKVKSASKTGPGV